MATKSLYGLHNDLPFEGPPGPRLEINPAVVVAGRERKFGLSAVCLGPRLSSDGQAVALELECDGERVELEALEQRSEGSEESGCLTVALFAASAELLLRLVSSADVRVSLGNGPRRQQGLLSRENRDNVDRFLRHPEVGLSPGSPEAVSVESVAV